MFKAIVFSLQSGRVTKVPRISSVTVGPGDRRDVRCARPDARRRCGACGIATLRAIGCTGLPVVAAVMLETMRLAPAVGVIGGVFAWAIFNRCAAPTLAAGTVGQRSSQLRVAPDLLWTGLKGTLDDGVHRRIVPGDARHGCR